MLKQYIENYLIKNNIPLINSTGKSTVTLIIDGYRVANWSAQGASNWTKKYFPNKPKNIRLYTYILNLCHVKHCSKCKDIKNIKEFSQRSWCKICFKEYQQDNLYIWREIKARRKLRTPSWADITGIKEFYKNCPEGYEVDHIIPLNGKTISGLHVLENLQYLPAKENRQKYNKF